MQAGTGLQSDLIGVEGAYPVYGGNGVRGYTSGYTHNNDCVLIGRQGALCGNINYAMGRFWASEHAVVATPLSTTNVYWLGELLRSMNLGSYSIAAAQPGLAVDDIRALIVACPPIAEQNCIASFLGTRTARIDRLAGAKLRLTKKLREKRAALIAQIVSRGLPPEAARGAGIEPYPKLKPVSITWLDAIPEHWDLKKLRYISPEITVGIVVEPSKYYEDTGVPCLRSLNVKPNRLVEQELVYISPESNRLLRKSMLHKGDLVVVRSGQPGTTATVTETFAGANCIDLIIIRRPAGASEEFLSYFLNSPLAQIQFSVGAGGAIQQHFNVGTAADLLVLLPPVSEQQAIAAYLDVETKKIDVLIERVDAAIDRLQEYRRALTTAAVTGQIDVRSFAIGEADGTDNTEIAGLRPAAGTLTIV